MIETRMKGCNPSNPITLAAAFPMARHVRALTDPPKAFDSTKGFNKYRMFLNDRLGCCVKSEDANFLAAITYADLGVPLYITDDEVKRTYFLETGGSDSGLNLADDLAWEEKNGMMAPDGKRHPGGPYGTVNPLDLDAFTKALYYFRWLKLAISTPGYFTNSSDGDVVDGTRRPGPIDHCVGCFGRRDDGNFGLVTWGGIRWATPDFIATCVGESWARYRNRDFFGPDGVTWDGFDEDDLLRDWAEFTGQPLPPSPHPDPGPAPLPPLPNPDPAPWWRPFVNNLCPNAQRAWVAAIREFNRK